MIITRLVATGDPSIVLELPPQLAVVAGLGIADRVRVVAAFADLLAGRCDGVEGTVLVDGAEFDVEPELCEMLELAADRDVVVLDGDDLPSPPAAVSETQETAEVGEEPVDRVAPLQRRLEELSVARATLVEEEAAEAAAAEDRAVAAEQELAERIARRDELTARLIARPAHDDEEEDDEAAAIEREAAELAARRTEFGDEPPMPPDLVPVEAAVEAFRFIRSWEPEPLPEAMELADRVAEIRARQVSRPASTVPEWLRAQTLEQLAEARAAVAAAEPQNAEDHVDPDRAAALEEAHAAVDEAKDRAGRRFVTPLVRRRLAAAIAAERSILEELGFSSYSAYLLGRASGRAHDTEADRRLTAAKAALADAEAVWGEIEGQSDWGWPGTADEEDALRTQARALVGPVPVEEASDNESLERLLRNYRTPAPDWRPAADAVVKALAEAGADVERFMRPRQEDDAAAIDAFATTWLTDARVRAHEAKELAHELRRLESAEAALERRRRNHDDRRSAAMSDLDALVAERATVEAEVAELQAQLESSAPLEESTRPPIQDRLAALDAEAAALAAEIEKSVAAADQSQDEAGGEADHADHASGANGDDVLAALATRLARRPSTTEAGPLPLLVDDALEGQPPLVVERALALLLEAAGDRQVIYLTDDDAVVSWATTTADVAVVRSGS